MIRLMLIAAFSLLSLLPAPTLGFYGDGPLIPATAIFKNRTPSGVREEKVEIAAVSSEGYIQGSEPEKGQVAYTFAEVKKMEFQMDGSKYLVTLKDGSVHTLKFGLVKTHHTSPTFDCITVDPKTGEKQESMLDAGKMLSIEFGEAAPENKSAGEGEAREDNKLK